MRAGVVTVVLVVICGYFLYEPFPEDLEEPWKVRLISIMMKLFTINELSVYVGYDQFPQVRLRLILDWMMKTSSLDDNDLEIFDTTFDSVKVRVYKPRKAKGLLPGIVYLHGGGWVYLSVDTNDDLTRILANESNTVVVSVDYRLAPKHQFPIPFEDCLTAVKYFLKHAKQFGANPTKVGIAGDSAGGNLAAAVTQRLVREKNKSLEQLKFQILIYPPLQGFDFKLPSMSDHPEYTTPLLKTRDMVIFWLLYNNVSLLSYADDVLANRHVSRKLKMSKYSTYVSTDLLPEKYRKSHKNIQPNEESVVSQYLENVLINPDSSPLMSTDLSGLPPSLVVTAEYDPLRDDGLLYVKRLKNSGVKVLNHHEPHSSHGFFASMRKMHSLGLTNFEAMDRSLRAITSFIKQNT